MVVGGMKGLVLILAAASLASAQMRNENDLDVVKRCVKLGVQITCTTPNVTLRDRLEIATECNNRILANAIANSCTRNGDSGIFCGEATYYVTDVAATQSTCATAIAGGNCSAECKMGLQTLRNELGCCITRIFNTTDSAFAAYLPVFNHSLWSRCEVNPVDACPGELPYTLNPQRTCSYSELQSRFLPLDCKDARDPRVRSQTNCDPFFKFLDEFCSLDAQNNFCLAVDAATDFSSYIIPLRSADCFTNPMSCSSTTCSDLFEQFVGARGCCINAIYNSTNGYVFGLNQTFLANGTLFRQCRLQTPSSTCRTFIPSGSLKLGGFTFLLLIPLVIMSLTVN